MTRPANGSAETARHPEKHVVRRQAAADPIRCAESVLNREHEGIVTHQRFDRRRGGRHPGRLGCNDHEIAVSRFGRVRRRVDPHRTVSARAFDPQPPGPNGIDVFPPRVDCPDLVAGRREQTRVHRAHRTGTDHRNPHDSFSIAGTPAIERAPRSTPRGVPGRYSLLGAESRLPNVSAAMRRTRPQYAGCTPKGIGEGVSAGIAATGI